jgi:hypothetical protein
MKKILLLLLLPFAILFANVGKITISSGDVTVTRDGKTQKATAGLILNEKDQVLTKAASSAQLVFKDGTAISLGANSNFKIDEYLFEESNAQKTNVKFGVSEGAFRAITGKIGKIAPDKFKIETKTATIGIRGTRFLGIIPRSGLETIACTRGAIIISMISPMPMQGAQIAQV